MKKQHKFKYPLGIECRDKITGFTGVITARIEFITGCDQFALTPTVCEGGRRPEPEYFDESRIEIIPNGKIIEPKEVQTVGDPGCDSAPPSKG